MKKAILFIGLILIIAALGVYIFIFSDNRPSGQESPEATKQQQEKEDDEDEDKLGLLEWLKGEKGVLCSVQTGEGAITVKTRDNKVRVDGIPYAPPAAEEERQQIGSLINDGEMVYIWSGSEGMKYNIEEMNKMMQSTTTPEQDFSQEDYDWEEMVVAWEEEDLDYDCRETRISDDSFIPPNEVKFIDWSETMQKIEQMQQELEAGINEGETMNQEDIEQYLEDMGYDEMMQEEEPALE